MNGSFDVQKFGIPLLLSILTVPLAYLGFAFGLLPFIGLIGLPFLLLFIYFVYKNPRVGVVATLVLAFTAIGLTRYLPGPLGLSIDVILALTLVIAIFSKQQTNKKPLADPIFIMVVIWFIYCLLQLINPEAVSKMAWFYAVRGVAFYMFATTLVGLLYFNKDKDLDLFINIWFWFSIAGVVWGMKQLYIGLDDGERAFLATGAYKTHILFGQLRVFSFFSDAGQFGAAMAHTGLTAVILAIGPVKSKWRRLFFIVTALVSFYGMLISGTRGALAVPAMGTFVYLLTARNFRIFALGVLVAIGFFVFLKYTAIGNNNYNIRRLRSALDPNDASLQVRLENQKLFKAYLASRPFGGGIGSGGSWGVRFSPNTFLAQTALDSWYVKIWAETGVIGLFIHLFHVIFILFYGYFKIPKIRDALLRQKMMALHAGFAGIALASYGNPILGQMPTGIVLYLSFSFLILAYKIDKDLAGNTEVSGFDALKPIKEKS
jgi:O-antigen ligase